MCGRYTLTAHPDRMRSMGIEPGFAELKLLPRFNIAPTQQIPIIFQQAGSRVLTLARWGLVPPWSKDPKGGAPLINARAETVAEKPSFRSALKTRRCLIPADGFFEWRHEDGKKQPFYFQLADGDLFAFAGLWERWESPTETLDSATIITTTPNDLVATVHDRMPVILPPAAYATWLDPAVRDAAVLVPMLVPFPAELMTARPVSSRVGSPKNDDPGVLEPPG